MKHDILDLLALSWKGSQLHRNHLIGNEKTIPSDWNFILVSKKHKVLLFILCYPCRLKSSVLSIYNLIPLKKIIMHFIQNVKRFGKKNSVKSKKQNGNPRIRWCFWNQILFFWIMLIIYWAILICYWWALQLHRKWNRKK